MDFITCLRPESVPRNKPDIVCMNNRTIYFWIQPLPVKKYDDLEGRIAHNTLPDLHNYVRHIILSLLSLIQQSLINKSRVWLGLKAFFTEFLWIYYHQLTIIAKFCLHLGQRTNWLQISMTPDPRALLCVTAREDELWGTLEQDSLRLVSTATTKKKTKQKSCSDWSIQVRTRAVECTACLAWDRVFPYKYWSKHAQLMGYSGPFLIQRFQKNICTTNHRRPKLCGMFVGTLMFWWCFLD